MKSARRLSPLRALRFASALLFSGAFTLPLDAQQPPPQGLDQQRFNQALSLFQQQKYAEAAPLFESIQKDFPTSVYITAANFQLGLLHYFTGDYDKSASFVRKNLEAKNIPREILEASYSLIPQALSAKATKMPPEDSGRIAAFEAAIKEFDAVIQKFPESEEVETANYGKARALYQIERYEDAAAALRVNMQKFPKSESALDNQFMLALVLATQANVSMRKATAKDPTVDAAYTEAERLLSDIVQKRTDLAVVNDARFQLGELFAARAGFAGQSEEKEKLSKRALENYRQVEPKEDIIKAQNERLKGILDRMRASVGDPAGLKRLQRLQQREQEKLANLEGRGDQTLAAKIKSAQVFLALEKFDEARTLSNFVAPFAEDPEQKKQILYLTTVTYATQRNTEKAVEFFDRFFADYGADPIAENLPLLVGAAFLDPDPNIKDAEKAMSYFRKQSELYPKSSLSSEAVMQEALAMIELKQYDEALKTLKKFLDSKPTKEQAAAAEFGLATVYRDTDKTEEAIKGFKAVRDKYPETQQGEQAAFWAGQMTLVAGNPKVGAEELGSFLNKYPNSDLVPEAMLFLGQAQSAGGQKEAAIKTYDELAARFPKKEPSEIAYFQKAGLLQNDGDVQGTMKTMRTYIDAYPESARLGAAYDYVQQIQVAEKKPLEAVATLEEFVKKRPNDPETAKAYYKISNIWRRYAEEQGRYLALSEEQRGEWRKGIDASIAAAEKLLENYPESDQVSLALANLLGCQKHLVQAKLKTESDLENYFLELGKRFAEKPATKNKVIFTLAGFVAQKDKPRALEMMSEAYNPELVYAPADLDLYATALIEQKPPNLEEAEKVFQKLAKDYPLPAGTAPDKAPRSVSEPQAMALFGEAKILELRARTADAAKKYDQLKKTFPWSPKLAEADFGIAFDLHKQKKFDDALKLLVPVARNTAASAETRARAMMLIGHISRDKGDLDSAINNYMKLGAMFEGVPELAAEGLWWGAQLLEKKAGQ
ncbi:MAG: tetratricopeptide repeat protein [Verrucomicrobiota bacterium]|nr:tetratricopeptide repeat protein [Verrucomicrobiota bacterium]